MKPPLHITADKWEILDFPKLPSADAFIHKLILDACNFLKMAIVLPDGNLNNSSLGYIREL